MQKTLISLGAALLALPSFADVTITVSQCSVPVDWCKVDITGDAAQVTFSLTGDGNFDMFTTEAGVPIPTVPPLGGNNDEFEATSFVVTAPVSGWVEVDGTPTFGSVAVGGQTASFARVGDTYVATVQTTSTPPSPPQPPVSEPPLIAGRDATLRWINATVNEDNTPYTNPMDTEVSWGSAIPVDCAALPTCVNVAPDVTSHVIRNLTPGVWYFSIRHRNTAGVFGQYSETYSREVVADTPPPPPPPTGPVVVANVAGANVSVAWGLTALNKRSSTVKALVPVGTPCIGTALFRYRNQDYYRFDRAALPRAYWWGSESVGDDAVVACARTQ